MNSTDFLNNLQKKQKEYELIRNEIREHEGEMSKSQAERCILAVKLCQSLDQALGGGDPRWAKLKERYADQARTIANYLQAAQDEPSNPDVTIKASANTSKKSSSGADEDKPSSDDLLKSKEEMPSHGFDDVTGMESVKRKLMRLKEDVKKVGLHKLLDMDPSSAMLFYGPPGCGKTFIIEAFIHELMEDDFSYMRVDCKDVLGKYQGESEKKVSSIFETAIKNAPCIMFFDEIDNLCIDRNTKDLPIHKISITETFLNEYNHLQDSGAKVYFLAATNFPNKIDTAMTSRMSLTKIGIPDKEAKEKYIERALSKASLTLDDSITVEKIGEYFTNCGYRDIKAYLTNVKNEVIDLVKDLEEDEAVEAITQGRVRVTETMCQKALEETIFNPVAQYLEDLEAWEDKMGILPKKTPKDPKAPQNPAPQEPEDSKGTAPGAVFASTDEEELPPASDGDVSKKKIELSAKLKLGAIRSAASAIPASDKKSQEFNPTPFDDIFLAFVSAYTLFERDAESYEACRRLIDEMEAQRELYKILGAEAELDAFVTEYEAYIGLNYPITRFYGFKNSSFANAYDPFFTIQQGNSVQGYDGTCGIIASCNVLNQQTGSRWDEADGVHEFVAKNLCEGSGGTWPESWTQFLGERNVSGEVFIYDNLVDEDEEYEDNLEFNLDKMSERFRKGESTIIALFAYDLLLTGAKIDCGRFGARESLNDILSNPEEYTQEELKVSLGSNYSNHAVTVAGYSYDENNSVTGVWINDTGGFSVHSEDGEIANRIFISKEKFESMKNNTTDMIVAHYKY